MNPLIKIIPMAFFVIFYLYVNRLINNRIKTPGRRRRYKKYFFKDFGLIVSPVLTVAGLSAAVKYISMQASDIINYILMIVALLMQVVVVLLVFPALKEKVEDLKRLDEWELMRKLNML